MRTGGFPCRLVGCVQTFAVLDQKSMESLRAASAERTEHEIAVHDYHHVVLAETRPPTPGTFVRTNRPRSI